MTGLNRTVAVFLAAFVVLSAFAPLAAAAPSGMTTVPDSNITQDVPDGETVPVTASELEGAVLASSGHADTMEIVVTTPEHADEVMGSDSNVIGGGEMALVFRDSADHDSREVAVDAGLLRDALGYSPEMIRGTHSSGETWRSKAVYEDGYLSMQIESWSSNTITFSGTVDVAGTYTDGSEVSYSLSSVDAVSDIDINMTGKTSTETETETVSGSGTVSMSGNIEPVGPSGGQEPVVTYQYNRGSRSIDQITKSKTWTGLNWGGYGGGSADVSNPGSSATTATITVYADGSEIASRSFGMDAGVSGEESLPSPPSDPGMISDSITVEITSGNGEAQFTDFFASNAISVQEASPPSSFTVTHGSTTTTISGYSGGEESIAADLGLGDKQLSVDTLSSKWTLSVEATERTQTVDATISINGHTASHSGVLPDGETVSLSANESWVESSNTIDVSVGDGTLSTDAPTPSVDLAYQHDAQDKQSVNYTANKWSEQYNVSRTYADANSNAQLTIPHAGNVVAINSVETQVNGNGWSSTSDWALDGTTLTVDIGDISSGDTVQVRTDARRVAVAGGEITVVEPTVNGNRLDTKIRLDSWGNGDHLGLGGSPDGRKIHYTYNDPGGEYTRIESSGVQQLYLPNAAAGSEMRVSTIPVQADVKSGAARFEVRDPSTTEPKFRVDPGSTSGDSVEYTFVDAADGQKYVLYSVSQGVVRDSGTANSPLTLEDDDSEETLQFQQEDSGTGGTAEPSGPLGPIEPQGDGPLNSVPAILLAYAGVLIALYLVDRGGAFTVRNPVPSVVPFVGGKRVTVPLPGAKGPLFWGGSVLSTLIVLEFLSSGLISRTIFRTVSGLTEPLGSVVPLAGIVAVGLVGYYLYQRFIVGQSARDIVIRSDGGNN